jgi:hypothetical protein
VSAVADWGQRWRSALDELGASGARAVARGHALARRGAVAGLELTAGRASARVAEDRGGPVTTQLRWSVPDVDAWERATSALADQLRFTAALLDGDLPAGVEEVLADAGVRLIPDCDELEPRCRCPEPETWCRHAAAVHFAVAARLDRDPTLLLRLQGRDPDVLLREVRAVTGSAEPPPLLIEVTHGLASARGDLDAIALHPLPPDDPGALLRHLGEPPGVSDERPLLALVERAAAGAWRLAAGDGAEAADEELLLAELRAQRVASADVLAAALGRDPEEVRAQLDVLFERGAVLRTGSGDRLRYRAAAS